MGAYDYDDEFDQDLAGPFEFDLSDEDVSQKAQRKFRKRWKKCDCFHYEPQIVCGECRHNMSCEDAPEFCDAHSEQDLPGLDVDDETVTTSRPDRFGVRWSEEEERDLLEQFMAGAEIDDLAAKHQRNRGGILARLSLVAFGVIVDGDGAGPSLVNREGEAWTERDDKEIRDLYRQGCSLSAIAHEQRRELRSVAARLVERRYVQFKPLDLQP
jgi:hypothetical protein